MPTFFHDGLHFNFRSQGAGHPFVFQHGLGGDATQTFASASAPSGWQQLTLECRGHGETRPLGPEDRLSIPQFVDDLRHFLDSQKIATPVIGGISMGAALSLEFALRHPNRLRALILSRPAWLDQPRSDELAIFQEIARALRRYGPLEGAQRFETTPAFQTLRAKSPDNANSLLAQFAHPRALETVAKLERIPAYRPSFPKSAWHNLSIPTLVLGNDLDRIHPLEFARELASTLPNAQFVELPPKSTEPQRHLEDSRKAIASFLSSLPTVSS